MKAICSNSAPPLTALLIFALLSAWATTANASASAGDKTRPAQAEQDVWLRWKAARDTCHPSTGTQTKPHGGAPTRANKATGILGMAVSSSAGDYLGRVQDVVFDWQSGRVAYVVVNSAPDNKSGKLLALRPTALKPGPDQKHLVLDAETSNAIAAQGFGPREWPRISGPGSSD